MPLEPSPHHRPRFHISQRRGYLNDPNGPVEVEGTTHLFFQSRPTIETSAPVEWGHATSDDLVDWRMHDAALRPTGGGLDTDGCWSGTVLRTPEGLRAFFSGHDRSRPLERVLTALSVDGGYEFGPPDLVFGDPDPSEGVRMLRDPFVWSDEVGTHMVLGSTVGDRAAMRRYEADGAGWRFVGEMASAARSADRVVDTGEGWECPQLIRIGDREVALVGSWSFAGGTDTVLAFPVDDPDAIEAFDSGDSFYAPSVMRASAHGPVVFGWLRETGDEERWHRAGWAGAISLPRRAWLERDSLRSEPLPGLQRLRQGAPSRGACEIGAQSELVSDHVSDTVRIDFGSGERLDLHLDIAAGSLGIDLSRASRDEGLGRPPVRIVDAFDAASGRPAMRALLDGSVLEVFTSGGRSASIRVYPESPPPWRVSAGERTSVWRLRSAVAQAAESSNIDT